MAASNGRLSRWERLRLGVQENLETVALILVGALATVISGFPWLPDGLYKGITLALLVTIAARVLRGRVLFHSSAVKLVTDALQSAGLCFRYTPTGAENYRVAVTSMIHAREVCATYFLLPSWRQRPIEQEHMREVRGYFRMLDSRVAKGRLYYRWLVSIENTEKLEALLAQLENYLKMPETVRQGYTALRILRDKSKTPRINMQINDCNSVVIGFASKGEMLDCGAVVSHPSFATASRLYFDKLWDRAIPIVDSSIQWENLKGVASSVDPSWGTKVDALRSRYNE